MGAVGEASAPRYSAPPSESLRRPLLLIASTQYLGEVVQDLRTEDQHLARH